MAYAYSVPDAVLEDLEARGWRRWVTPRGRLTRLWVHESEPEVKFSLFTDTGWLLRITPRPDDGSINLPPTRMVRTAPRD